MSDAKKSEHAGIPTWQQASSQSQPQDQASTPASTPAAASEQPQQDNVPTSGDTTITISTSTPTEQEKLLDLVNKFLQDPQVQHASVDKKMSFLTSKGLSAEQAKQALDQHDQQRQSTPTTTPSSAPAPQQASSTMSAAAPSPAPQPSPSRTQTQPPPPPPSSSPPQTPPQHQETQHFQQPQPPPSSAPPIITYPETLARASHPTPLITPARLTTFLYTLGTLSALIYGTSTYLVSPMLATLTDMRHDFASNAGERLGELNKRLENAVVAGGGVRRASDTEGAKAAEEQEEEDDASAMFTRTQGTQTTTEEDVSAAAASGYPSSTSSTSDAEAETPPLQASERATTSLTTLTSLVSSAKTSMTPEADGAVGVTDALRELKEYLLGLTLDSGGGGSGRKSGDGKDKVDELARVKAEIRGVKGTLLSARNFPGVGRVGGR